MDDIQRQIEQARAEVARHEAKLVKLETEIIELERELDEFRQRYNRVIQPITNRLQAVKDALAEMEKRRRAADDEAQPYTPPPGYEPIDEQYRRAQEARYENHEFSHRKPKRSENDEARLKNLYRQLARKFHPDFAQDDADREHRTRLMVMINDAYTQRDWEALRALEEATAANPQTAAQVPLAALHLRQLRRQCGELATQVADLEYQRSTLLHNNLMDLKIEEKLAKLHGRDLLREMAGRLENEYRYYMTRLDQLRVNRRF